jgi:RNA polymerase sigma-70 factor (family 1)
MYLYGKSTEVQPDGQRNKALISIDDKRSYETLFKTYYQPLCNYACSILKDIDEAEEVVQGVFLNIWKKWNGMQIETSARSYLYRAVHNDCLNKIKHDKVKAVYAEDYRKSMRQGSEDGSQILQAKQLAARIDTAIDQLPKQCGEVFRMNRFAHLKYAEIAGQLNISVKTVEAHMGKALRLLRGELKDYLPFLIALLFTY